MAYKQSHHYLSLSNIHYMNLTVIYRTWKIHIACTSPVILFSGSVASQTSEPCNIL